MPVKLTHTTLATVVPSSYLERTEPNYKPIFNPKSSSEPCQFLRLPLEVRIMIYRYLIPNTPSQNSCGSPQRLDGPCFPAILNLSRDIRKEVLAEWYNQGVCYEAKVDNNGVRFLGHQFFNCEHLPLAFYSIKSLHLNIKFEWRPARQEEFKTKISQILPVRGRLEALDVTLEILHPCHAGLKGTPKELQKALERTLSPLQALTSLSKASMYCCLLYRSPSTLATDKLESVVKKFFSGFEVKNGRALQC